jgi:hypothetical protein
MYSSEKSKAPAPTTATSQKRQESAGPTIKEEFVEPSVYKKLDNQNSSAASGTDGNGAVDHNQFQNKYAELEGDSKYAFETQNVGRNAGGNSSHPGIMMYETAAYAGLIPVGARRGKLADDQAGDYTITPYYVEDQGGFLLSYYTAGRDVPVGQDGEYYFREEWIIAPDNIDEFRERESGFWNTRVGAANMVYAGGFEDFEKELQLGNYGAGTKGYYKSQWTDPIKLLTGVTVGVMGLQSLSRGVNPANLRRTHPTRRTNSTKIIDDLAADMKANGFNHRYPIEVFEYKGSLYIMNGHHRVAAANKAGVTVSVRRLTFEEASSSYGWTSAEAIYWEAQKYSSYNY